MKRYYLSKVIGDGTEMNPLRAAVADYGVNHVAEIQDGKDWCLVTVESKNHSALLEDPNTKALPDVALDIKCASIQKVAIDKMKADVESICKFSSAFIENQDGFRDVIRYIGKQLNPNFDENNFDVSE